mgnify:CR=1 FL=1
MKKSELKQIIREYLLTENTSPFDSIKAIYSSAKFLSTISEKAYRKAQREHNEVDDHVIDLIIHDLLPHAEKIVKLIKDLALHYKA